MTTPNPYGPEHPAGPTAPGMPPGAPPYGTPPVPGPASASGAVSASGPASVASGPYGTPAAMYGPADAGSPFQGPSPYQVAPYRASNQLASIALILSLLGLATWLTAPAGAICGQVALAQIRRNPGQGGHGMALAAVIVGWVITVLGLAAIVWFFWLVSQLAQIPDQS